MIRRCVDNRRPCGGRWRQEFDELMLRIGGRFARVGPRRRMAAFVRGLLAGLRGVEGTGQPPSRVSALAMSGSCPVDRSCAVSGM